MKKRVRTTKRIFSLLLFFLFSINSFAGVVSDNDGSAFITKAEFDTLTNNFLSQIDSYNQSLDSKIDGAIASYLAGIRVASETQSTLMLWSGQTLGLVEDYKSHTYVDGNVGGTIALTSWVVNNNNWINGNSTQGSGGSLSVGLSYLCFCHHKLTNEGQPFKYLVADYGNIGSTDIWDLHGYAAVNESASMSLFYRTVTDYTNSGTFNIGLCSGFESFPGTPGVSISNINSSILRICEMASVAIEMDRGSSGSAYHNLYEIPGCNTQFTSSFVFDNSIKYITNANTGYTYTDVFPSEWYGLNSTTGHDVHTGKYDLYDMGWRMDESAGNDNFHLKTAANHTSLYGCGNKAYMRKCKTESVTSDEDRAGWIQRKTSSSSGHDYYDQSNLSLVNLFKSNTGTSCVSDNLYSSELGAAIGTSLASKCTVATIGGQDKIVAPLYIGLPLGRVQKNDKVKIDLSFLDATNYQVGFYIDGFPNGELTTTTAEDAGCKVEGTTSHIQSVTGPLSNRTITLDIDKSGLLFFKFGATTTSTKGTIKLPNTITIIRGN